MSEHMLQDLDPLETQEWVDSLQAVLEQEGPERAHYLLEKLIDKARRNGTHLPYKATTAYLNTIPAGQEPHMPGDQEMERRIRAIVRWNALAMVLRGSKKILSLAATFLVLLLVPLSTMCVLTTSSVHQMRKMAVIWFTIKVTSHRVFTHALS